MLPSLTSGTEFTLFPKWSKTVIGLTLDDTVKSIHCLEACSSWNFSINSLVLFQYNNRSPLSNMLLCLTASSLKNIQLRISEKDSTA